MDEFATLARANIADIMKIEEPIVVELGYIGERPVSPNLLMNILIGIFLGMFVMAVIIVLLYMMDDTVKSTDDIEKYLSLNTLSSIPLLEDEAAEEKNKKKKKNKKKTAK